MMSDKHTCAVILTFGYTSYALPISPSEAGKLVAILSKAVVVQYDYAHHTEAYRMRANTPHPPVEIKIVRRAQILPPYPERKSAAADAVPPSTS
jgi:hypothetical protein